MIEDKPNNLNRWLYAHGRKAEAVQVLARLMDTSEDDPEVKMIESEMEEAVRIEEEQGQLSLKTLLNDKSDLKKTRRLVLCFMIYFLQMFTGINVIVFYCEFGPNIATVLLTD